MKLRCFSGGHYGTRLLLRHLPRYGLSHGVRGAKGNLYLSQVPALPSPPCTLLVCEPSLMPPEVRTACACPWHGLLSTPPRMLGPPNPIKPAAVGAGDGRSHVHHPLRGLVMEVASSAPTPLSRPFPLYRW